MIYLTYLNRLNLRIFLHGVTSCHRNCELREKFSAYADNGKTSSLLKDFFYVGRIAYA